MRGHLRQPKSLFGLFCFLSLLLLGEAAIAHGESLKQYHDDIGKVKNDLTHLYTFSPDDYNSGWTEQQQLQSEADFFTGLSTYLPPKETIELDGAEVEVDNRWLHERVEALKATPRNSFERDGITNEIHLRLSAIEAKTRELLNAKTGARSKDEEKQKLAQILNRPEYRPPENAEKNAVERWYDAFSKWLSDLFPRPEPIKPIAPVAGPAIGAGIIQFLVLALAVAAIGFAIWWFLPGLFNRYNGRKEKKDDGERIILGERLAANESSSTLFEQAESMAREGNFRGAIRKGYIALLCELGDRKVVRLAQHKTNRDYLRDVSKNQELHRGVKDLTWIFENHWYGLSSASADDWGAFRENYRSSTNKF